MMDNSPTRESGADLGELELQLSGSTEGGTVTLEFPRELVRASAGSGKTFRISSRIIQLLAAGEAVDSILASTFTRKAAGEILGRVLTRLAVAALNEEKAAALSAELSEGSGDLGPMDSDRYLELLAAVVRQLHRLNIGTLDAFFIRTAQIFAAEIGLPPGWGIGDEPRAARLRSEALQEVMREGRGGGEDLAELVRLLNRGARPRSVHENLLDQIGSLHYLLHQIDPVAKEPWSAFPELRGKHIAKSEIERLADSIADLPVPTTKSGSPNKSWARALTEAQALLRTGDWFAFATNAISVRVLQGTEEYSRIQIDEEIRSAFREALDAARIEIGRQLDDESRAMGRLIELYDEAVTGIQKVEGVYRFDEITRLLGGASPIASHTSLYHRLDSRIRHLLLDEFQDTSPSQWSALEPLADRLQSGNNVGLAAIVADPKQSIYGWRGAEPGLVRAVGERYELKADTLAKSWRSSQVVLDVVNSIFTGIASNPAIPEEGREVAEEWAEDFSAHTAAKELPGYVRVLVGPDDESRSNHRPLLLAHTADLVKRLQQEAPGRSIGVLTRENKAVARLIHELRLRGITASEEGGNPLIDAAPVSAIMALLRLADHPADRVSRYHLAKTPIGEVVGLTDPEDEEAALRLAYRTRQDLLNDGYGRTISRIAEKLIPEASLKEARRLSQLVESAFRFDGDAGLRTRDFIKIVETERIEDPTTAPVRVMTIHQSKGLEFNIVVLPELDFPIYRSGPMPALPLRDPENGPIVKVYPYLSKPIHPLFPEIEEAYRQSQGPVLRDALSGLYVALTRAEHALYIVLKPDGKSGPGTTFSPARILREALAPGQTAEWGGAPLFETGDPDWHRTLLEMTKSSAEVDPRLEYAPTLSSRTDQPPVLRAESTRRLRILPRRTPSELEGGSLVDLGLRLRLDNSRSLELGTLIHAWCQEIEWLEDGVPGEDRLYAIARGVAPTIETAEVEDLIEEFKGWIASPEIVKFLSRESYPMGARVERETRFVYRAGDTIVEGIIDRLVLWGESDLLGPTGPVTNAEVLDFKSDNILPGSDDELGQRTEFYRPQLNAYQDAVSSIYGLDREAVGARLLFLRSGRAVEI